MFSFKNFFKVGTGHIKIDNGPALPAEEMVMVSLLEIETLFRGGNGEGMNYPVLVEHLKRVVDRSLGEGGVVSLQVRVDLVRRGVIPVAIKILEDGQPLVGNFQVVLFQELYILLQGGTRLFLFRIKFVIVTV